MRATKFPTSQLLIIVLMVVVMISCQRSDKPRVLVFSKTKGFYHGSIPAGIAAVQKLGDEHGFDVDTTKDASFFTEEKLKQYRAVIFLSTTGNVLNNDQQVAFERYIQAGGGYVGIHAAADTEYEWPWYNKLVGAYFLSHPGNPNVRMATIIVKDTIHASTRMLPKLWERNDEWYNYKSFNGSVNVLAKLDESTYEGGEHGDNHPIAWYHEYDGGRAFYTGGGHTDESFSESLFVEHLLGGIQYAMGGNKTLDFSKAYAVKSPEENRFKKVVLANDLNEPMELAVAADGRVFFIERSGRFFRYNPGTNTTDLVKEFKVMPDNKEGFGNGLLGITLDPDFLKNNYIYFFYTPDKKPARQNVSRFTLKSDGTLDDASEKIIIEIPIDLEVSAHTGGSLAWDKNKNLFISTGDNTVPFESDGYAPLDERPGRITFDAQRSSGNTNDLRGKILRIHPEPDGRYTIPDGNLFSKGMADTRPEIFVMGCRNPYRISVDQKTSVLYWGEIGPDSGIDGAQGPKGYDEFNQAKKAGNFGWPYFVGNNIPYIDYDFATKKTSEAFNAKSLQNNAQTNTGKKELPSPQSAMIWYPYDKSEEFPILGTGGRSAMSGPVYHYDDQLNSSIKFPEYYDKGLFVFEWMRNWVYVVRLDEQQNFKRLEPFMGTHGDFRRPIDMEFGADGAAYVLEYGSVYGIDNVDARLVRIEYNKGNRTPVARISVNESVGHTPLTVKFSSSKSYDFDEDPLSYTWQIDNKTFNEANTEYIFSTNGAFSAVLTVKDPSGLQHSDTILIRVGNTLPQVKITTNDNPTFYFDKDKFNYRVDINDKEDKQIDNSKVNIHLKYIAKIDQVTEGHALASFIPGKALMQGSDCKACHQINGPSVGPSFTEVSKRYQNDKTAVSKLADKIITGGGGVWGDHAMNAHPQLSKDDAQEIVKYILTLTQSEEPGLPVKGSLPFSKHKEADTKGRYILTASYTDGGGESLPLTGKDLLVLQPARVQAEFADQTSGLWKGSSAIQGLTDRAYFVFKKIDLKHIKKVTYKMSTENLQGTLEIRTKSIYGEVISTLNVSSKPGWDNLQELTADITDPGGTNDLFFVFRKTTNPDKGAGRIDWIEFKK